MNAGADYRFEHLRTAMVLRDLYYLKSDLRPGDRIVEFDLLTLNGGRFQSAGLDDVGPALIVFGSYTCRLTASAMEGLSELHKRFGDEVQFVMVDVREAHPVPRFANPQTSSRNMKMQNYYVIYTTFGTPLP